MRRTLSLFLILALGVVDAGASEGLYLEKSEFLNAVFDGHTPAPGAIVIDSKRRREIEAILGHRFSLLRVRYWSLDGTRAWIFDEVGKTEPITIGVSTHDDEVASVRILEFRETRGWEVRYPFFTDQFSGAKIAEDNLIDRPIDGITGATLSVAAVSKVVRLALLLDGQIHGAAAILTTVAKD